MSTITKERLEQLANFRGAPATRQEEQELARIALASLEAEPVAEVCEGFTLRYIGHGPAPKSGVHIGDMLFTAPPAPVSDSLLSELLGIAKRAADEADEFAHAEFSDDSMEHSAAIADWERRAAMLHGAEPVSTAYKLQDGWVACSERMPEDNAEQEVLACFKGGDISTLYYFEGRWDDAYGIVPIRQDVTHWMPLPAAPQQEAKP